MLRLVFLSLLAVLVTTGCKIRIAVPEGGSVLIQSQGEYCTANEICTVDVVDVFFDEVFVAVPATGYAFAGWEKIHRGLCGGKLEPCHLLTSGMAGNESLEAILESDEVFHLRPMFQKATENYHLYAVVRVGGDVYKLDLETFDVIETISKGYYANRFSDIAYFDSQFYALSKNSTKLYEVDFESETTSEIGPTGIPTAAQSYATFVSQPDRLTAISESRAFDLDVETGLSSYAGAISSTVLSMTDIGSDGYRWILSFVVDPGDYLIGDEEHAGGYILSKVNMNNPRGDTTHYPITNPAGYETMDVEMTPDKRIIGVTDRGGILQFHPESGSITLLGSIPSAPLVSGIVIAP